VWLIGRIFHYIAERRDHHCDGKKNGFEPEKKGNSRHVGSLGSTVQEKVLAETKVRKKQCRDAEK